MQTIYPFASPRPELTRLTSQLTSCKMEDWPENSQMWVENPQSATQGTELR